MLEVKKSYLVLLYHSILHGEMDFYTRQGTDGPNFDAYKYPINLQVKELYEISAQGEDYAEEYSDVIIKEMLNDLEENYGSSIKLI